MKNDLVNIIYKEKNVTKEYKIITDIINKFEKDKINKVLCIGSINGGYKLNKPLSEYTVGTILKLTEGSLAPVSCLEEGHACCDKEQECITYPMWKKLDEMIDAYLESVTLEDLLRQEGSPHTCKSCDSCGK